ncbi:MAG: GntR family transcriptional regulator [Chloroflexi bacterium]|nr:GntR family transcriptional regulator [Chloroflexota bacterium]
MAEEATKTLADYVLETLREGLLSGRYPPDSRLDQKLLAEELRVSLIPVRESLRRLEAEGLVRIYPHRGVFVVERSADEVKEISCIREVLEELATQLTVPNLSDPTLKHLADLIEQMEQALTTADMARFLALSETFHFAIYETSGQKLLLRMIRSLWDRTRLYHQRSAFLPEHAARLLAGHKDIYAACRAGDAIVAGQLVRCCVRQTMEVILARMALEPTNGQPSAT